MPTKRQYEMAYFMQHGCSEGELKQRLTETAGRVPVPFDKILIEAFRGIGKSYVAAAYCIQTWLENPHANIIVYSASKPRADAFCQFVLRLIQEIPEFEHLKPGPGQRESVVAFDVGPAGLSQTPSLFSVGIFGQGTGYRADLVIFDDVEIPNNSETQMQREKLETRTREAPGAILKPNGRVIVLGTPQDQDSIYNKFPERGYRTRVWPSEYPSEQEVIEFLERGHEYAPEILEEVRANPALVGHATEPGRFPDEELNKRKLEYGLAGYELQFKLNTRMSDALKFPLRVSKLIVYPLDPNVGPERIIYAATPENQLEVGDSSAIRGDMFFRGLVLPETKFAPWEQTIMYIDPAGKGTNKGTDEMGYAIVSSLHGMIYLRDSGGFRGYDHTTLVDIARLARDRKVNLIVCERNFGDGMFTELMRRAVTQVSQETKGKWGCSVEDDDWQSGSKENRICDILEPVISGHRMVVNQSLLTTDIESTDHYPFEFRKHYRLFYQMTRIKREKDCLVHDDRLDALAGAVRRLISMMGADPEELAREADDRRKEEEIENFIESCLSHRFDPESHRQQRCAEWA